MMTEVGLGRRIPTLAPDVRVIEKKQEKQAEIKVAAYCRVSTDLEIQKQSLDIQIEAYNRIIREHPGWVLAGVYADKGISGTSVKNRDEFLRMIEDAKAGKIQYILAKSISRFSRNTVDALAYVRELKSYGVSVYFEKEKLDTGNVISEFVLSIFAASAQEEIISLSNNMKVGRRMRYAAGIVQWTHIYGYRNTKDGRWVIEETEAEVVRRIFREFINGKSMDEICEGLMADGIPSSGGKTVWRGKATLDILHNEKYIGDVRMQKSFISDPIQHIRVNNRDAVLKQYYKENHHEAIIDRETFFIAQKIIAMRGTGRGTKQYPFYGTLKCPLCGENMVRFSSPRDNATFGWTCGGKHSDKGHLRKDRTACPPFYFQEDIIIDAFWRAMQAIDDEQLSRFANKTGESAVAARMILKRRPEKGSSFPKLVYMDLYALVSSISFPQWTEMRVEWKCGLTSSVNIKYDKITDLPYPIISKQVIKRPNKQKQYEAETYIVNGVPQVKANPEKMVGSIRRMQQEVENLLILEPGDYDYGIPRVYGSRSDDREKVEQTL